MKNKELTSIPSHNPRGKQYNAGIIEREDLAWLGAELSQIDPEYSAGEHAERLGNLIQVGGRIAVATPVGIDAQPIIDVAVVMESDEAVVYKRPGAEEGIDIFLRQKLGDPSAADLDSGIGVQQVLEPRMFPGSEPVLY